jgi:hypothetical protein
MAAAEALLAETERCKNDEVSQGITVTAVIVDASGERRLAYCMTDRFLYWHGENASQLGGRTLGGHFDELLHQFLMKTMAYGTQYCNGFSTYSILDGME